MGHTALNMMSVEDVGDVVCAVFGAGQRFWGKTLSLSAHVLTIREMAQLLSHYLRPLRFVDKQVLVSFLLFVTYVEYHFTYIKDRVMFVTE